MWTFLRQESGLLGIDIGSSAVKLIELGGDGVRVRVERYAVAPLPQTTTPDEEGTIRAVREAVTRSGTRIRRAATALPGSLAITKIIRLPARMGEEEIAAHLKIEHDQYIPAKEEAVRLDFQILGPSIQDSEGSVDVLLAAVRPEPLDSRIRVLEKAGLHAAVVDLDAYAQGNALALLTDAEAQTQPVGVADLGNRACRLTLYNRGRVLWSREHPGPQQTEPSTEDLVEQIARLLQLYGGSEGQPGRLVLAGGGATRPGLTERAAQILALPVTTAHPFAQWAISSRIDPGLLSREAPALTIAAGLALRCFDP